MDAKIGKLLLLGATMGCLSPALTIAACLANRSPFSAPLDKQDAALHLKLAMVASGVPPRAFQFSFLRIV